jgi:hypothetical protein
VFLKRMTPSAAGATHGELGPCRTMSGAGAV